MSDSATNVNDIQRTPSSVSNGNVSSVHHLEHVLIINKEESDDIFEKVEKGCSQRFSIKKITVSTVNRKIYRNCSKLSDLPSKGKKETDAGILDPAGINAVMSDSATNVNDIQSMPSSVSNGDYDLEHVLIINKEESDNIFEKVEKGCSQRFSTKKISLSTVNRKIYKNCSKLSDLPSKGKKETDAGILDRRQKQIDYGKNTAGYDRYVKLVPKKSRKKHHPKTPPKRLKCSRRAWDGLIRNWRQQLHFWDSTN